jgi:ribosomal protein L12E/L44/L45/RPP1/RPP2
MVAPFILMGASGIASFFVGKKAKEKESEEKINLVMQLAEVDVKQAKAINAVKKKSVEELRFRVKNGIGPFAPLPTQASARAQAIRESRVKKDLSKLPPAERSSIISSVSKLSDTEKAEIMSSPNRKVAINALVKRKVAEASAVAAVSQPPGAQPPAPSGPVELKGPVTSSGANGTIITEFEEGQTY